MSNHSVESGEFLRGLVERQDTDRRKALAILVEVDLGVINLDDTVPGKVAYEKVMKIAREPEESLRK